MPAITKRKENGPAYNAASAYLVDVDAASEPHASPAKELQDGLAARLSYGASRTPRWSGAVRFTIILGGSVSLWAGILAITKTGIGLLAK